MGRVAVGTRGDLEIAFAVWKREDGVAGTELEDNPEDELEKMGRLHGESNALSR